MTQLTVSLIVHDDFSHIRQALASLYNNTAISFRPILTVNSGAYEDIEKLQNEFPDLQIQTNIAPRGFAANHNAVLQTAATPFVALLNDDISLKPGALDTLVGFLREHSDAGLVGPAIYNLDGSLQLSVFSDPSLLRVIYGMSGLADLTKHGGSIRRALQKLGVAQRFGIESLRTDLTTRDVPVIVGVAMVVRREAYQQAGLMDEFTRFYGEEYGWHLRLRQNNWKIVFVPKAEVIHFNPKQVLGGWKLVEHRKANLSYFYRYRKRWQSVILRLSIIIFGAGRAAIVLPFNRQQASDYWNTVQMALTWKA